MSSQGVGRILPCARCSRLIIRARDGLRLNGYLTLPAQDAASGRMPLAGDHGVPMPATSGVSTRFTNGFANRGYAVLRSTTGAPPGSARRRPGRDANGAGGCMTT